MTTSNPHAPYIETVAADMPESPQWWYSDAETGSDGMTCTLSAVFEWDGEVSPDHFPDGLILCWNLEAGWQSAACKADGSNEWPVDLPLPTWALPADVSACAVALLRGELPIPAIGGWHDDAVMDAVDEWVKS